MPQVWFSNRETKRLLSEKCSGVGPGIGDRLDLVSRMTREYRGAIRQVEGRVEQTGVRHVNPDEIRVSWTAR
jgi:hypothetical protein